MGKTTNLNLNKQLGTAVPDVDLDNENWDILDEEVASRAKTVNNTPADEDGNIDIPVVPFAENLRTESSQTSAGEFNLRSTGGAASIETGDAWIALIKGNYKHTGFVPESIAMTVLSPRDPDTISATLDAETFIAYVGSATTVTLTYDGSSWNATPAIYGVTVSGTPIEDDQIVIVWDGETDPVMTVTPAPRIIPAPITATIDRDTFVAYVGSSGTIVLEYDGELEAWDADPTLYGITVTGTPMDGDTITVVYVKEVRGTITQSNPTAFKSTGWNLYDYSAGYARVCDYSEDYGFCIEGTYTALKFSYTLTGEKSAVVPIDGYFAVPGDGYLWVEGGNNSDTCVYMTWADWLDGIPGDWEGYTESTVSLSSVMSTYFPYGLMKVGNYADEINLNVGLATSWVERLAYNASNLAYAKGTGRDYEYDENFIYVGKASPTTYSIVLDGSYHADDHGIEFYVSTDGLELYTNTLYGANLKNKLERDTLTLSQQTLTTPQKTQVRTNIGAACVDDMADAYDATNTYAVGDLCIYNNRLYKCKTAISTAEAWTAAHWEATTLSDQIVPQTVAFTPAQNVSLRGDVGYAFKVGRIVFFTFRLISSSSVTTWGKFSVVPSATTVFAVSAFNSTANNIVGKVDTNGDLVFYKNGSLTAFTDEVFVSGFYLTAS